MGERLEAAQEIAAEAAAEAMRAFGNGGGSARTKSGPHDLVTEADERVERLIAELLAERYPQDGVLGEEGTADRAAISGYTWAVDPVDGTWNFAGGIPHWCVVLACADESGVLAGVIHDAARGESWSVERGGEGLLLNGEPAPARPEREPDQSTWAAALGRAFAEPRWMRLRGKIGPVRITGSLGLDLAWTAAGRIGALAYTCSLNPWDVWAGELMASERGLDVVEEPENRLLMVMPAGWIGELGLDRP